MITVTAVQNFDHDGLKKRGDVFEVSPNIARRLHAKKLVIFLGEEKKRPSPVKPAGEKSPVLPAGQALPEAIVKKSGSGGRKKKDAPLSVRTRHLD